MTYSHLLALVRAAGLSPEELGKRMGVSGMTLRRWSKANPKAELPKLYVPAVRDLAFQLLAEGILPADSPAVIEILHSVPAEQYSATLKHLGLESGTLPLHRATPEAFLLSLSQIGSQEQKQALVNRSRQKLFDFRKLGREWSERINLLWKVLKSPEVSAVNKIIAYGALFYLLTPIDFIPDHIPALGLMDDFLVLGLAATYYKNLTSLAQEKI